MNDTRWTAEQKNAIDLRNSNLLVSAAAGSGKTAVLVERITQIIIHDEVPIDQMLVVTYTNAAAGEMRARIESALSDTLEAYPEKGAYLQQQIKRLSRASIKTFHAFCLDIIRNYFYKVDLDPSFRMINNTERQILIEKTLDATLEQFYEASNPRFIQFVESYTGNRDDQKLRTMILDCFRFIQSQAYPIKWLESQTAVYQDKNHSKRIQWISQTITGFKEALKQAIKWLEVGIDLCQMPGGPLAYADTLNSDIDGLSRLINLTDEKFEQEVLNFKFDRIKTLKKDEKDQCDVQLIDQVKTEIRDKRVKKNIFTPIKSFFEQKSLSRYIEEINLQAPLVEVLKDLTTEFSNSFDHEKRKKNVLDFNDLEHYAIKILEDENIGTFYRNRFRYVFVDEYQDASGIQENIIQKIVRENNLFMVGDIKQSIYKFRLADPKIFLNKYNTFLKYDVDKLKDVEKENKDYRIDLRKNFRTRDKILESVNHLFGDIMTESLGDINYDDQVKLNPGMVFEAKENPCIEINLISQTPLENEGETEAYDDYLKLMKTAEIEAHAVANKIESMIGSLIYHPKENKYVPCRYRDIVILIRSSRSWSPVFESVFLEKGIPIFSDSQSGYFNALEIKFAMSLIQIISNPYQDIELLTVLRSPVCKLTIEELVDIRLMTAEKSYLFDGILSILSGEVEVTSRLYDKLLAFKTKLDDWLLMASFLPLDEFIWYLLKSSDLYEYCMAMPGGKMREANLKLLIDRAVDFKMSKIVSLSNFVRFIEDLERSTGDMGAANSIGENDDVVRLMSFHKSKGLEFPVVILSGLSRRFNFMDTRGDLLMHEDEGIALSFVDLTLRTKSKSLPQNVIKTLIKKETLSEEMRVLYVGLTRPIDQLILFATYKDLEKKFDAWGMVQSPDTATSFMDWIMPVWQNDTNVTIKQIDGNSLYRSEKISEHMMHEKIKRWQSPPNLIVDEARVNEIKLRLDYETHALKTVQKVTVSALKGGSEIEFRKPNFIEGKKIKGTDIGTLTHVFMEHIHYNHSYTKADLESLKNKLVLNAIIEETQAKFLNLTNIEAFLNSTLGNRIKNANRVYKETPYVIKTDEQLIQGVIDLYFEEDEAVVLVDFKTDRMNEPAFKNRLNGYQNQIRYYKDAIEKISQQKVKEAYLVLINDQQVIAIE